MFASRYDEEYAVYCIEPTDAPSLDELTRAVVGPEDPAHSGHDVIWDFRKVVFERGILNLPCSFWSGFLDSLAKPTPLKGSRGCAFLVGSARDVDIFSRYLGLLSVKRHWVVEQDFEAALTSLSGL